jgi:cytochrome c oxidase subunit 2
MFGLTVRYPRVSLERGSYVGLQQPKRSSGTARRVGLAAAISASLTLLGSCSAEDKAQIRRLAMPEPASDRAPMIYDLWAGSWLAAILVGILVWGLILYAVIRFRRRKGDDTTPVQTRYHLPIEILYTVAPTIMVLVLFYYTVTVQNQVLADEPDPDHHVTVVGQQWSWTFNYVKDDALGGQTTVYEVGTTAHQPTLVLPVNETVEFKLTSPDVIHSFWVPAFLFKLDVIPGRTNKFSLTPTEVGRYEGRCAELCGVYHSRMLFDVRVVSAEEYAAYLQRLEDAGQVGLLTGGEKANSEPGLEQGLEEDVQGDQTTEGSE